MFKCSICGRKFKTKQALGGHMSHAHPQEPSQPPPAQAENATSELTVQELEPEETEEAAPESEDIAAEIREKIARGYNFEQLTKQFGYAPRSVRREMEKAVQPTEGSAVPATYKRTEILEPEALLRRYIDGSYEDQLELRGMMKLRAAMLLVTDLINLRKGDAEAFALEVKPIIDLMKETRAEQDAAAERARGASMDIAREAGLAAAEDVAARVAAFFEQRKPDIASTPDPMAGFAARAMETLWNNIVGKVLGGTQPGQIQLPPGWTDERQKGGQS